MNDTQNFILQISIQSIKDSSQFYLINIKKDMKKTNIDNLSSLIENNFI